MMMKSNIKPSKIDAILIPIIFFVPEMKAELLNARYVIVGSSLFSLFFDIIGGLSPLINMPMGSLKLLLADL